MNPLFRGVLAIDGELRLSVVSENIWFLPAAYFSVLCVLRLSGLLHAHMENLTSESLPHSAIVFLPSNVGRQQSPAPAKSFFFVEYLSAVRLFQNQQSAKSAIPTPAPEFHSFEGKVFKGA